MFSEVSPDEWEQLRKRADWSSLYQSAEWGQIWSETFRWGRPRYLTYTVDDEIRALIPLFEKYDKGVSVLGCEYGGVLPLSDGVSFPTVADDLHEYLEKPVRIKFHPQATSETYIESDLCTFLLDVREEPPSLMDSFRNTTRHGIEEAIDAGISSEKGTTELIDSFYPAYLSTMKHNNAVPYPRRFFEALGDVWSDDDWSIYVARYEGEVVAAILVVHHETFTHYFKAGNTPTGYEKNANSLLVWQAIQDAHDRGSHYFDFGATPEGSGMAVFKKGWRGEKREIPHIEVPAPNGGTSLSEKKWLKQTWGKLPPAAMEALSSPALWLTT